MGMTTNSNIPFAKSLVDYIFRWLGMEFVAGYREANAPKRPSSEKPAKPLKASPEADPGQSGGATPETTAARRLPTNGARETDGDPQATAIKTCATGVATETERLTVQITDNRGTIGATESTQAVRVVNALDRSHAALMGDAPACDVCGAITLRNGTCYKCLNCGNSMGCS
jgi:ribonucleoside-diphosphate reductase alpha chain